MNVNFKTKLDRICDYIPLVSSITNAMDLIRKAVFALKEIKPANNFEAYIENKSNAECVLLLIPGIGNLAVAIKRAVKTPDSYSKWIELKALYFDENDPSQLLDIIKSYDNQEVAEKFQKRLIKEYRKLGKEELALQIEEQFQSSEDEEEPFEELSVIPSPEESDYVEDLPPPTKPLKKKKDLEGKILHTWNKLKDRYFDENDPARLIEKIKAYDKEDFAKEFRKQLVDEYRELGKGEIAIDVLSQFRLSGEEKKVYDELCTELAVKEFNQGNFELAEIWAFRIRNPKANIKLDELRVQIAKNHLKKGTIETFDKVYRFCTSNARNQLKSDLVKYNIRQGLYDRAYEITKDPSISDEMREQLQVYLIDKLIRKQLSFAIPYAKRINKDPIYAKVAEACLESRIPSWAEEMSREIDDVLLKDSIRAKIIAYNANAGNFKEAIRMHSGSIDDALQRETLFEIAKRVFRTHAIDQQENLLMKIKGTTERKIEFLIDLFMQTIQEKEEFSLQQITREILYFMISQKLWNEDPYYFKLLRLDTLNTIYIQLMSSRPLLFDPSMDRSQVVKIFQERINEIRGAPKAEIPREQPRHASFLNPVSKLTEQPGLPGYNALFDRYNKMNPDDYYKLFNLEPNFTLRELDKAAKKELFKYHPDKLKGEANGATEELFKFFNNVWKELRKIAK